MPTTSTIASTYTNGLVLPGTAATTIAVTAGATISNTGQSALLATASYSWSIQNAGAIRVVAGQSGASGIVLSAGAIANTASGQIAGYTAGISVTGAGTVANQGTIVSGQTAGSAYLYNPADRTATILSAAIMLGSGSVTNSSGGLIHGALGGIGTGGAGSIANAGSIVGGQFGIFLDGGGTVGNLAAGTIGGGTYGVYGGIQGPLSVSNQGYIYALNGLGVELFGGGSVTNASSATIAGGRYGVRTDNAPSAVFNVGALYGARYAGVLLAHGGQLSNATSGIIYGGLAGFAGLGTAAATVANAGSIGGYGFGIVAYAQNAQIYNDGIVSSKAVGGLAQFGGAGVALQAGGSVTNAANGVILGRWIGVQIGSQNAFATGTIFNQGNIFCSDGTYGAAIWVHGSGVISNSATGKIEGGPFGIVAYQAVTLIDSGYLVGTSFAFDAVNPGYQQRVILNPGATIVGTVYGGNPIGGSVASTLELASGSGSGILSGIGTQFLGFAQIVIDAGSNWTLTGANTIVSGATLAVAGTLTNAGTETGGPWLAGGEIVNLAGATIRDSFAAIYEASGLSAGTIVNAGLLAGPASGAGAGVVLFSGGTLMNNATGTITGSDAVYINGTVTTANAGTVVNAGQILGSAMRGVELVAGGTVTNTAGGTISGATDAVAVQCQNPSQQSAAIFNQGRIVGGSGYGVLMTTAGNNSLVNGAGGVILGGKGGVYVAAGGTVTNAGSIGVQGPGTSALRFGAGASDRLILYPGASFTGIVDGGNMSGSTAASVLILASSASAGTLTGLGVKYLDFAQIAINPGANWTFAGSATLAAGQTLTNGGALTDSGTLSCGGSLLNSATGTISATNRTAAYVAGTGVVVNNGTILASGINGYGVQMVSGGMVANASGATIVGSIGIFAGGGATVVDAGTISGSKYAVAFGATGNNLLELQQGFALNGTIGGFAPGDTIELDGIAVTGTQYAAGTLSLIGTAGTVSLALAGNFAPNALRVNNVAGNALVTVLPPPPVIGGTTPGQSTTDMTPIAPFSGVTIADSNANQTETVTVTVSSTANGTLSGAGIASFNAATGVYTLTGSPSTVAGALDNLVFTPTGHQVAPGQTVATTFAIQVTDTLGGSASNNATTVIATAVASPIVLAGAASGQQTTDAVPIRPFSGIAIADPNFGQTETVTITLSNKASGTLTNPGIGSFDGSTGVYTVTGSTSAVGAAIAALVFTPSAHQVAPGQTVATTFTIKATDTAGVTASNAGSTVLVTALATPIAIAGTKAGQTTTDASTLTPFASVTLTDPNFGQTETVTVTLSNAANGTLTNLGGGTYSAGKYTVSGSAAAVVAAIEALVFVPTAHQVSPGQTVATTFAIKATDTSGIVATDSNATVLATAAPAPIVIANAVAGQATNDATALVIFNNVTITDPNYGQTETATVTLSNAANGSLRTGGAGSFNAATGVYTVTGSAGAVSVALDSLVFVPTQHQVAPGQTVATTFTIQDTDTSAIAATNGVTTVIATAVASPPTIAGSVAGQKTTDVAGLSVFSRIAIADLNFGQTETVTVTLSNPANGTLANLGGGTYNAATGIYTVSGTVAAVGAAIDTLVFVPAAHQVAPGQTVTTSLTIKTTDTAGATATDTVTTVVATAVASAVTIGGAVSGQTSSDLATVRPFANVAIADPNFGQTETLTVTLSNPANGGLTNLGIGSYSASTGVYTAIGSLSAVNVALNGLIFTPTAHQVAPGQTVVTGFTIKDVDSAAVGATNSTTSNIATAAASPVVITGTVSSQATNDATVIKPFSQATVGDPNFGQTETLTVTLSAAANGILSDSVAGTYNASTGVYAVSGTAAAVTAALDALMFTPTAHQVSPNTSVVTTFTIKDTDTAAVSASNSTTTVTTTALAGTPTIAGAAAGQKTTDAVALALFTQLTIADPNAGQSETVTITLSSAANGLLGNLGGGSYNAATGVYTVSGTAAAVDAAIVALSFTPAQHLVALGQTFTTTFTIAVTDTAGVSANNSTTTVVATAVAIASAYGTSLVQTGGQYGIWDSGGTGPLLQYQNTPITVGQFGSAIAPIGAVKTAAGYQVAWSLGSGLFIVWNTDRTGNYTSSATPVVSGTSYALQTAETTFGQDLNGDGTIGLKRATIATNGTTTLVQAANEFEIDPAGGGTGPLLQYQNTPITAGQFGAAIAPIGAVQTGTGYEVAWNLGSGLFIVWNTDSNGNYTSSATPVVSSTSYALGAAETTFGQDLNGDGTTGLKRVTIATNGTTVLIQAANEFEIDPAGGGTGPLLQYQNTPITAGQFGAAIAPIGAVQTGTGYEVAWSLGSGLFIVWNTDNNGNYTSSATPVVSSTSYALEAAETTFGQDLNGDGTIGLKRVTIATNGTTTLVQAANEFEIDPAGGGTGPLLQYQNTPITAGQFGAAIAPIGAVQTGTGYEVAWSLGSGLFIVWNTDSTGNYTSSATPVVSSTSYALGAAETTFGQDLNGDGTIGLKRVTIATNGTTALVQAANEYEIDPAGGGTGPLLQYQNTPITAGQFGAAIAPIGAVKTAAGYQVAWSLGSGLFIVWNTDNNGNYTSSATPVVAGQSFALEDLEPTFAEDLNGDGRLSRQLIASGTAVNLSGQSQSVIVNLGANTASASSGLSLPTLTFLGTPDTIALGTGAAIVEYALQPSSGIETVSGFIFGTDELNIDLAGAPNNNLVAFDTTVNGVHAIALAGSSDRSHGIVLTNLTGGLTADQLLASHATFVGGHALIS